MTDHQSDAELHMERLVQIASNPMPTDSGLTLYDNFLVAITRRRYANLMLSLAVRLEAGRAPGT